MSAERQKRMIGNFSERKIRDVVAGAAHDVRREELPINQSNAWLESIQHYACLWGGGKREYF
jgi:hypothetical protein